VALRQWKNVSGESRVNLLRPAHFCFGAGEVGYAYAVGFVQACRWRSLRCLIVLIVLSAVSAQGGERAAVPIKVQAEILCKVVQYDRGFETRVQGHVNVLILTKPDRPESRRAALQMQDALSARALIGGHPHTEFMENYAGAPALSAYCRSKKIAVVFVTPEFDDDAEAIRGALTGQDILSVGAVASYVTHGIVLGFDLVAGKPKMLVNIPQARSQRVFFQSDVLRLMTVFQ
jgi:hypothetical protein